jgi:hypothetical protein
MIAAMTVPVVIGNDSISTVDVNINYNKMAAMTGPVILV